MICKWEKKKNTNRTKTGESGVPGRVSSSCTISGTNRVISITNPKIGHARGKEDDIYTTKNGTYQWLIKS
jgi:hypothetical protein